jgi:hypothetical protein
MTSRYTHELPADDSGAAWVPTLEEIEQGKLRIQSGMDFKRRQEVQSRARAIYELPVCSERDLPLTPTRDVI